MECISVNISIEDISGKVRLQFIWTFVEILKRKSILDTYMMTVRLWIVDLFSFFAPGHQN